MERQPEHFSWQVPYKQGKLKAIGIQRGLPVCEKIIQTTGKPARIRLSRAMEEFLSLEEIPPFIADNRDIVVVNAEVVDHNGLMVPTAQNKIEFSCTNNAQIIGVGNGNIISHEPNKATSRKAFNGLCIAILQAAQPGTITVRANSDGLSAGELTLHAAPPQATALSLVPLPYRIRFDQTAMVDVFIVDKFGTLNPYTPVSIRLVIQGPGTFENNSRTMDLVVTTGKKSVKIIPSKKGTITLSAFADGLRPARCKIHIK